MARNINRDVNKRNFLFTLIVGVLIGYITGFILFNNFLTENRKSKFFKTIQALRREEQNVPVFDFDINNDPSSQNENTSLINELQKKVKILCWIATLPKNHKKKAIHVYATWGKRCDIILFFSSGDDDSLPIVKLDVKEGRQYLWDKTKKAFKYIYEHYFDKADWFLKADDDTYLIIENLKYLLVGQNTSEGLYFGWRFKHYVKQGFMSGGAGYVLSKTALEKFVKEALPDSTKCHPGDGREEDIEMGRCLENVGVEPVNTRDSLERERFLPLAPYQLLTPGHLSPNHWYLLQAYYHPREGPECCSDAVISFHYVIPDMMYVIDNFIYKVRPYGIDRKMELAVENSNSIIANNSIL